MQRALHGERGRDQRRSEQQARSCLDSGGGGEVQDAQEDTGWLDREAEPGNHVSTRSADVAIGQAAIEVDGRRTGRRAGPILPSAAAWTAPRSSSEVGRTAGPRDRGQSIPHNRLSRAPTGPSRGGRCTDRGHIHRRGESDAGDRLREAVSGCVGRRGVDSRIDVDGVSRRVDRDQGGIVHAPHLRWWSQSP